MQSKDDFASTMFFLKGRKPTISLPRERVIEELKKLRDGKASVYTLSELARAAVDYLEDAYDY